MEIHYALYNDLSIVKIQRNSISHLEEDEVYECYIEKTYKKYTKILITDLDIHQAIQISDLHLDTFVEDLKTMFFKGDKIYVRVYFDSSSNQKRLERITDQEFNEIHNSLLAITQLYQKYKKKVN